MSKPNVTMQDFISPEFRGANPEDYEFNLDNVPVLKKRWENAVRKIHSILGFSSRRTWEIDDVIAAVDKLKDQVATLEKSQWGDLGEFELTEGEHVHVACKIEDGSILQLTGVVDRVGEITALPGYPELPGTIIGVRKQIDIPIYLTTYVARDH